MTYIELFFLLQVMDWLTTMIGVRMGGAEMNPTIAWLMAGTGTAAGLTAVKMAGFGIAGLCVGTGHSRVIIWLNYLFGGIVLWNLANILRAVCV